MIFLIFLLSAIGASQMWSNSKIMGYVRRKLVLRIPIVRDALLCPVCSSFWIAVFLSIVFNPLSGIIPIIFSNICLGLINYLICGILFKNNILTSESQ
jgi:hypothetical protein